MLIVKYTHACVRLEDGGRVLVIDPGIWSEPAALDGAEAVLVTHEHIDHVNMQLLAASGIPIHAPAGAAIDGLDWTPVTSGQTFEAGGFRVRAVGERHAQIYGGLPDCANLGYVVDDSVYHPGDALHVPAGPVETLLVPAQGSWMKLCEAIDFVRAVRPARAFPIHDAQLNERGLGSVNAWFTREGGTEFRWLAPGERVG
jgi:L-ascorbate metabolism protein UlaG (beta-lactamase superfamily)